MRPSAPDPEKILTEEILAEARRESEQTIRRAQQEAETLLAKAFAEADRMGQERLNLACAEASRRKEFEIRISNFEFRISNSRFPCCAS